MGPARQSGGAGTTADGNGEYVLEDQIGHLLRRAHQRATATFLEIMGDLDLTPTQYAALVKIADMGEVSQNHLGRLTAMDPATMQGVIRRLRDRGYISRHDDPGDRRRTMLRLTDEGRRVVAAAIPRGRRITEETLAPLTRAERRTFLRLLRKIT